MTLYALYRRAASLARAHTDANARTAALDVIVCRRVHIDRLGPWRACGARAARVTMDRGFAAAVSRSEARDRMTFDPYAAEEERRILESFAKQRAGRRQ